MAATSIPHEGRQETKLNRRIDKIARSQKKKEIKDVEMQAAYLCFLEKAQKIINLSLITIDRFNLLKDDLQNPLLRCKSEYTVSDAISG